MASNLRLVKSPRKKVGVLIGRFQPFHMIHGVHLTNATVDNDLTIVLVGSANQAPTIKNPFSFAQRKAMISNYANSASVVVLPIEDTGGNNTEWIYSVQTSVKAAVEAEFGDVEYDVTLYGSEKDKTSWYVNAFPQWQKKLMTPYPVGKELSATNLRNILFGQSTENVLKDISTEVPTTTLSWLSEWVKSPEYAARREDYAFIEEYKKTVHLHPRTEVTVDGVVIQSGHVLVVRRANQPGRGLIALPGGFVKTHQTLIEALLAEITEETGLLLAEGKKALDITKDMLRQRIRGYQYFDDPLRSLRGRTITHAFLVRLDDTKPLPIVSGQFAPPEDVGGRTDVVETFEAFWMPLSEALSNPSIWFEDHQLILKTLYAMIKE